MSCNRKAWYAGSTDSSFSQAATYVACAPKSNAAYMAVDKALDIVKNEKTYGVPVHLQDAHYKSAGKLGHGIGYKYAHDYKNHYVKQQYLSDELEVHCIL